MCCGPSLELPELDGSHDGSQTMFVWRNMANYPYTTCVTPSHLEHCSDQFRHSKWGPQNMSH